MPSHTKQESAASWYKTNPFTLAVDGISKLYKYALGIFWIALVLGLLNSSNITFNYGGNNQRQNQEAEAMLGNLNIGTAEITIISIIALMILSAIIAAGAIIWGIFGYTAAQLAKDKPVSVSDAFSASFNSFWRIIAVGFTVFIRTFGWTLLFIIPGIIMAVRYSLSITVAFAEPGIKASKAVTRSAELTNGAWFDTYATLTLLNILSIGVLGRVLDVAGQSQLYRQLSRLKDSGEEKPPTHILSYLTLLLQLTLVTFVVLVVAAEI